ncbi:MAG: hypothetical protein ABSC24_11910 [Verrucomicrobiota bacterium]
MRPLFYILFAASVLLTSCRQSSSDATRVPLSFYVVSEQKIDGGRFIDTPNLPKLGYISATPDLVITRFVAVNETVAHSGMVNVDKDGKRTVTPLPDQPALDVMILPEDAQKFEALTEHNIGKQVLLMLGDAPLMAPRVNSPISTQSFQLTIGKGGDQKAIEDELKMLVH